MYNKLGLCLFFVVDVVGHFSGGEGTRVLGLRVAHYLVLLLHFQNYDAVPPENQDQATCE